MRRSLILLSLLVSYTSAPGTSPRRAETFGDWSAPVNVASLNTAYNDMYAVLSKDELTVYFTSDRPGPTSVGGDDLWFATRESVDAPWGPAQNMGEPINSLFADSLPMLSYDEHVMFFHSTRPGGCGLTGTGDIWMVRRHNRRSQEWEPPANLGCGLNRLNTDSTEIAPAFFEDPESEQVTLFYGSNRPGSLDFDVYASARGEDGYFGPGVLVPEFSSPNVTRGFSLGKTASRRSLHQTAIMGTDLSTSGRRPGKRSRRHGRRHPRTCPVRSTARAMTARLRFHATGRRCIFSRRVPPAFNVGRGTSGTQLESRSTVRTPRREWSRESGTGCLLV